MYYAHDAIVADLPDDDVRMDAYLGRRLHDVDYWAAQVPSEEQGCDVNVVQLGTNDIGNQYIVDDAPGYVSRWLALFPSGVSMRWYSPHATQSWGVNIETANISTLGRADLIAAIDAAPIDVVGMETFPDADFKDGVHLTDVGITDYAASIASYVATTLGASN